MTKTTRNSGAKKLSISKETLRQLTAKDLAGIRGASYYDNDAFPTQDCAVATRPRI